MAEWNPNISFFNNESCTLATSGEDSSKLSWKFIKYTHPLLFYSFFECKMNALGMEVSGFGGGSSESLGVKKSFAEAWERVWFMKKSKESHEGSYQFESSNGFAAGLTDEMAKVNSRNELIERAVVMHAWSSKTGWKQVKSTNFKSKIILIGCYLKGWSVRFYDLNSNLGKLKVVLAISKKGAIFVNRGWSLPEAM